jgi:pimeloyl-ACP methyl ester carboxylesterase
MEQNRPSPIRSSVQTASGRISYTEQGTGPVALFVHGVLLNGHLWRHQLADLSDIRRCIAVDLLAHGDTEIALDQDVSVTANAKMLKEFLDALSIDQVDLVGNDSGGGIAQIFAALYPERIRGLTLTDCDAHDNWPPEAFKPFLAMAAAGGLRGTLDAMLSDKSVYRSQQALGPAHEHPERLSNDSIEKYLRPLVRTEQRTHDLQRFLAAFDNKHTLAIGERLKTLKVPTLIAWGTDDVYFDVKWARWLADTEGVGKIMALAIEAGAVGCNLEDSFPANGKVREIVDQADRIRCARRTADAGNVRFFINARTDIFFQAPPQQHDDVLLAQAIERARVYAEVGADGLFAPGLADITLIARLAEASPLPLNIMVGEATPPVHELAEQGVASVSHGPRPYLVAMKALEEAARVASA